MVNKVCISVVLLAFFWETGFWECFEVRDRYTKKATLVISLCCEEDLLAVRSKLYKDHLVVIVGYEDSFLSLAVNLPKYLISAISLTNSRSLVSFVFIFVVLYPKMVGCSKIMYSPSSVATTTPGFSFPWF